MPEATDAAKKKAAEEGVDIDKMEGSGNDGKVTVDDVKAASNDGKFLVRANPEVGSYSHTVYAEEGVREFFRDPNNHPEGPGAQMVTKEEYAKFNGGGLAGSSPLIREEV